MAERVTRRRKPTAAKAAAGALEILHPERRLVIGRGKEERVVTVREYGFVEGLQLRAQYKLFLDALEQAITAAGGSTSLESVEDVFAEHHDRLLPLIATAADLDVAVVQDLADDDGYLLMQTWWVVNSGFFIRRLIRRQAAARLASMASPPAGQGSTTP